MYIDPLSTKVLGLKALALAVAKMRKLAVCSHYTPVTLIGGMAPKKFSGHFAPG